MRARTLTTVVLTASLGWIIAGCGGGGGGGNGNDNGGTSGGAVTPGFFIGQTQSGEALSIAVDSIHAIFFQCRGQNEYQLFDPPQFVANDGSFFVNMQSNGTAFVVTGQITSDGHINGSIGGTSVCPGAFVAQRCDASTQNCDDRDLDLIPDQVDPDNGGGPTPDRTPTPAHTSTPSNTTGTPNPTPSPTASPSQLCGNGVLDGDEECDKNAIDNSGCFEDVCTCEDFCDDAGGTLSCNVDCTLNFNKCTEGGCLF
jgi:hypothetical protein